jgi:cobalt/nickel transport system permease protein
MASLWHRSYLLNEMVYGAMLSRGYAGEPVVLHDFKTRLRDWVWLLFVVVLVVMLLSLGAKSRF